MGWTPVPVIVCLDPRIKQRLLEETGATMLHGIPACRDGSPIGFSGGRGAREGRAKRAPSKYNLFMGACVKSRPAGQPVAERFSECVVEWKKQQKR